MLMMLILLEWLSGCNGNGLRLIINHTLTLRLTIGQEKPIGVGFSRYPIKDKLTDTATPRAEKGETHTSSLNELWESYDIETIYYT